MGAGAIIGAVIAGGTYAAGSTLFGASLAASVFTGAAIGHSLDRRGGSPGPVSPTYDFEELDNTRSHVVPVPIIYGRNKVAGNLIYHRVSGDKQRLYMAVGLGEGPISGVSEVRINDQPIAELGDRVHLVSGSPPVVTGRAQATVRSRQGFPGGLTVTWKFDVFYRAVGTGAWTNAGEKTVTANVGNVVWGDEYRTPKVDWTHTLTGLSGQYEVRVEQRSVTLSNGNWELWGDTHRSDVAPTWEWFVGSSDQQPSQLLDTDEHWRYTAYVALHVRDAESVGGRTPTITSIVDGLLVPVWRDGQWVAEYSRNPAWCLLDYLRNSRYGLGIPDERIDLESFRAEAEYCDGELDGEPRFRLDYVMDVERSSLDVIGDMLATFRAYLLYSDGKLRLKVEKSEAPVYSFDMDNIVTGSFAYAKASGRQIPNRIVVEWTDPDADYQRAEAVYDNEVDQERRGEVISRTVSLLGITRASQAGRMARFYHDQAYWCNTFCEFRVGIDALHVEVGDVVQVSHDVPGWDRKLFRVIEIEEYEDDEAVLRCREYHPAIYHDLGVEYQPGKGTTLPNPMAPPPHVGNLQATSASRVLPDGQVVPVIRVTWAEPAAAFYAGAVVYWREVGASSWQRSALVEAPSYDIVLAEPGEYEVRVVSESYNGLRAPFDTAPEAVVNVSTVIPANVTGLQVDFGGPDAVATWNPVPHIDTYRVRVLDAHTDAVKRTVEVTGTTYTYPFAQNKSDFGTPQPRVKISVEARNEAGNYSQTPTVLLAINPKPAQPTASVESSLTQLRWSITSELPADFRAVKVEVGTFSQTGAPTNGIIDLVAAEVDDGEQVQVAVSVIDVFGQESDVLQAGATALYATERDLAGSVFEVEYESEQFPSGADPSVLYDGDPTTGITFTQAPTIIARHPKEERFGMVDLHVGAAVQGYVQVRRHGEETWRSVIGTPSSPHSFDEGENTVAFVGNRIVVAREVRIVLLSPVRVNEFTPSVYLIANHFLGGTMTLTDNLVIQTEGGNVTVDRKGLIVSDNEGRDRVHIGDVSGRPFGAATLPPGTYGEWSDRGGVYMHGYVRNLRMGIAEDGDRVGLEGYLSSPYVMLFPADLAVFDPAFLLRKQKLVIEPRNVSPSGFDVYAKLMRTATVRTDHRFSDTTYTWPGYHTCGDYSSERLQSSGQTKLYTTTGDNVTRVEISLRPMMHLRIPPAWPVALKGYQRLQWRVRIRKVGTTVWISERTGTESIEDTGLYSREQLSYKHTTARYINFRGLDPARYEVEVGITSKTWQNGGGNAECWLIVNRWHEYKEDDEIVEYPSRLHWLALEMEE